MINYVEFLRAKRSLIIVAVILAVLLAIAVAIRVSAHVAMGDWHNHLQVSSSAHVTTENIAGGTRTVVDDPAKHTHAVIVQHADAFRMDVDQPDSSGKPEHIHMSFGQGVMTLPLDILIASTIPFGLLVATMLGGALAKENDGHLEMAWTKPFSREEIAAATFAIDIAAMLLAEILAIAVYFCCVLLFGIPSISAGHYLWEAAALAVVAPVSWYAALTAWSASLRGHLGLVIGLGWPAALAVPGIARALQGVDNPVGRDFYVIFHTLSYADPIAYLHFSSKDGGTMAGGLVPSFEWALVSLAALAAVYLVSAVLQWRRVEA